MPRVRSPSPCPELVPRDRAPRRCPECVSRECARSSSLSASFECISMLAHSSSDPPPGLAQVLGALWGAGSGEVLLRGVRSDRWGDWARSLEGGAPEVWLASASQTQPRIARTSLPPTPFDTAEPHDKVRNLSGRARPGLDAPKILKPKVDRAKSRGRPGLSGIKRPCAISLPFGMHAVEGTESAWRTLMPRLSSIHPSTPETSQNG